MLMLYFISSKNRPSSPTTSPNDHVLSEYRLGRFTSDNTATTVPFNSSPDITAENIILAAKKRAEEELRAFDIAFCKTAMGMS
jgi:hypothetical protein